jgi:hypothetical protein
LYIEKGVAPRWKAATSHRWNSYGVAGAHADRGEAGGDRAHPLGVLAPGDLDAPVGVAQRDLVGLDGGGGLKRVAQRAGTGRRILRFAPVGDE